MKAALPFCGVGRSTDQVQSQETVARLLLTTMICFSIVSPGRKLCPFSVNAPGLPPKYASSGRLLRSSAWPATVGTQSARS